MRQTTPFLIIVCLVFSLSAFADHGQSPGPDDPPPQRKGLLQRLFGKRPTATPTPTPQKKSGDKEADSEDKTPKGGNNGANKKLPEARQDFEKFETYATKVFRGMGVMNPADIQALIAEVQGRHFDGTPYPNLTKLAVMQRPREVRLAGNTFDTLVRQHGRTPQSTYWALVVELYAALGQRQPPNRGMME